MRVGRYEVVSQLAKGGFGTVFAARSEDGRDVAVKVLDRRWDKEAVLRFEREIRVQGSLGEADGFVPLLDAGDGAEGPFLVMPLVPGGTLRDRLRLGPLSVPATLELGRSLAGALAKAHERGIVHRDLKPENVLFTAEGRPLVADLGLAKHFGDASSSVELSKSRDVRGTFGYMAPEQMRNSRIAGPHADVFSLGAILYECLAGAPAFEGDTVFDLIARVERGELVPLARRRSDVPRPLARVVARALSPDPASRFGDAKELLLALDGALAPERKRGVALALAGAVALGLALIVLALGRGRSPIVPVPKAAPAPTLGRVHVLGAPTWKQADPVSSLEFASDSRTLYAGDDAGTVVAWSAAGDDTRTFRGHRGRVTSVSASRDGATLATSGDDGTVRIWDARSGAELRSADMGAPVTRVRFAGASGLLAIGTAKALETRNAATLEPGLRWKFPCAGFSADGGVAALERRDQLLLVSTAQHLDMTRVNQAGTRVAAIGEDGATLVAAGADGSVAFWNVREKRLLHSLPGAHETPLDAALSPDVTVALTVGSEGSLKAWEPSHAKFLAMFGDRLAVRAVTFSPDGKLAAAAGASQTLHLWQASALAGGKGAPMFRPAGHQGAVGAVAFEGQTLATLDVTRIAKRWDLARDAETAEETGPLADGAPGPVAFVPGGGALCGVGAGTIVWQGTSSRALDAARPVVALAVSPDGRTAAIATEDKAVHRRDLRTGEELAAIALDRPATALAVAGDAVLVGYADGALERRDGTTTLLLPVGGARIDALAASAERFAVATANGLVRVLTLADPGRERARETLERDRGTSLAFSADGKLLACGTARGVAYVFEVRD